MPRDLCRDKHNRASFSNNLNIEFSILGKMREFRKLGPGNGALENRRSVENGDFDSSSSCIHTHTSPHRSKFPPRLKLYLHEGGGVEKDDRSARLFPCVHTMLVTSRRRYLVTGSDGLENRSRRNRQGIEEGARRKWLCSLPLRGRTSNLRFESPRGVHKSCVLGFRGSGN